MLHQLTLTQLKTIHPDLTHQLLVVTQVQLQILTKVVVLIIQPLLIILQVIFDQLPQQQQPLSLDPPTAHRLLAIGRCGVWAALRIAAVAGRCHGGVGDDGAVRRGQRRGAADSADSGSLALVAKRARDRVRR